MAALLSCWPNSKMDRQDTTGVWTNALAGLNEDQIRHGIWLLSQDPDDFPPPPGKFRGMCHTYRPEAPTPPALTDDSPERDAARARMALKVGELARSLGRMVKPKPILVHNVRSRIEQALCDHEWRPAIVGHEFCMKCGVLDVELADAFPIRTEARV